MPVKVSFQDEARFGRISDPTRTWVMPGVRPTALSQIIREYTYAYGAFFPDEGKAITMILPFMDSFCMELFLKEVSQRYPEHLILMVIDGAPNHRSQQYEIPSNIRLLHLPPYCPQLNPSENMWDEMREKFFANIHFNSMKELEAHLCQALVHYESSSEIVKSVTNWNWISNEICSISIAN